LRQKQARLYPDERSRHENEFARDFKIQILYQLDIPEILMGDPGDGNIIDVHLFLLDQIQQEIERPVEYIQVYFVSVGLISRGDFAHVFFFR